MRRAATMLAVLAAACPPATAWAAPTFDKRLYDAVDRSFSPVAFGTKHAPRALVRHGDGGCGTDRSCAWTDARGVTHCFCDEDDGSLFSKAVSVAPRDTAPVYPLGIGTARLQRDVVARVRRSFPQLKLDCDNSGDDTWAFSCAAGPPDSFVLVLGFNRQHRLTDVVLYAYGD